MKFKGLRLMFCLLIVMVMGGIALGQCEPDGHNDATTAIPIGFNESVTDYVCPADRFDYYYIDLPEGADVSGTITFEAEQTGTTLRIDGVAAVIFPEQGTTDAIRTLDIPIPAGSVPPGRYYLRVGHYSSYTYDHQYTLTLDLTLTGGTDCLADDNDDPANASELAFGSTVNDYVCSIDHLDIWHFRVTSALQGTGNITLTADPGEVFLYLYDSSETELFNGRTTDGEIEYALDAGGEALANGDYYIGIFLPLARTDENAYSLELRSGTTGFVFPGTLMLEAHLYQPPTPKCPWPAVHGGKYNASRSTFNGPSGEMYEGLNFDMGLSVEDMDDRNIHYEGLLAGNHNRVYFFERPINRVRCLYIPTNRVQWQAVTGSWKPPCLDYDGRIYYISRGHDEVVCAEGTTGSERWRADIPEYNNMTVEMATTKIYVAGFESSLNSSHIYVFDQDGEQLWSEGPLDGMVAGIAEGPAGVVYVQTTRALYKYRSDGVGDCWRQFSPGPVAFAMSPYPFGPVIAPDGNIWAFIGASTRWIVYHSNGDLMKTGSYAEMPRAVSQDTDGNFYVAFKNKVTCYRNYNSVVWNQPFDKYVDDMIMGMDNKLYVCYIGRVQTHPGFPYEHYAHLDTLDPTDGHRINTEILDVEPQFIDFIDEETPVFGASSLAISEGGKIAFLHVSGVVQIFNPILTVVGVLLELQPFEER